mmetsp:Transcript_43152/g.106557  ORF Transcript_43152/g.106557 Transcript_43152/m.106557 type:complete len:274 (+) Transcript_43152:218-1039(+)
MLTVLAMTVATSTTPRRFLVARHGETTWNKIEKLQGTLDESTLTPSGEAQALELGRAVAAEEAGSIHAVFVSSLGRARQTHEIVRAQFPESMEVPEATHTYELREIALGKWEGRLKHELATGADADEWRRWKARPSEFGFEDGFYPLRELMKRAERCWSEILLPAPESANPGRSTTTLVIAHGAMNRALMVAALGLPLDSFADPRFAFGNCQMAELEIGADDGSGRLIRWRWRHPGPASEWRTARQEQEIAALQELTAVGSCTFEKKEASSTY